MSHDFPSLRTVATFAQVQSDDECDVSSLDLIRKSSARHDDVEYEQLKAENMLLRRALKKAECRYDIIRNSTTWKVAVALRDGLITVLHRLFFIRQIRNLQYRSSTQAIPLLSEVFNLLPTVIDLPTSLFICNPSIISTTNGWLAVVRAHNYKIENRGRQSTLQGVELQNENWLVWFDDNLHATERQRIELEKTVGSKDRLFDPARNGIEDCRLSAINENLYITATAANSITECNTMLMGKLVDNHLSDIRFLPSPFDSIREKNWMPIVVNNILCAIYQISPFCLLNLEKNAEIIAEHEESVFLNGYSGSSQVIVYKDKWLCVVHRRVKMKCGIFYLHKLVLLDQSWNISAQSNEFFFEHRGIEFCAGLANKGDRFILSYGVNDAAAKMVELTGAHIETLLHSKLKEQR